MNETAVDRTWVPLNARERRVVGVLVEKQKTTAEYYPMTVAGVTTACNQKSNRDPVTNHDADDVEEILDSLRKKGATIMVEGSGRVTKWKHTLYEWLGLRNQAAAMAVLAELLLRGPQTEGDLRGRASRMDPIPDLPALQQILQGLVDRGLAVYLSPPGQRRGAVVTHGLYPPEELERVRQTFAQSPFGGDEVEAPRPAAAVRHEAATPGLAAEVAALREELQTLRSVVDSLAVEVQQLKSALGA